MNYSDSWLRSAMQNEPIRPMLRWAHLPECEAPPRGWSVVPFTDIATVVAGQSPPSDTYNDRGLGLPFLQGNGDFSSASPIPHLWCTAPAKVAEKGDTLISVRAPVGEMNRADQEYAIGRGLAAVRARDGYAQDFLHYALQRWRWSLQRVAQGTTFDAVTARHFAQLSVCVPIDVDEQAAIARILDAVDTAIERTSVMVDRAKEVKRALVQRVFSDGIRGDAKRKTVLGPIPKSWGVLPVSAVVTNFQYGLSVPMQLTGTMPILRMGDIQDGDILLSQLKFISLPAKVLEPYRLHRGDVLFNRTNSQEWVGKVGIYRHESDAVFASYLIRLIPDPAKIDNYYLGHVLGGYPSQCRIKRYATPGVQQVNVNATNLGKVLIPVPPGEQGLEEQREIAAMLESADAVIRSYEPKLAAQRALKKSLMADLLTGRVRVPTITEEVTA